MYFDQKIMVKYHPEQCGEIIVSTLPYFGTHYFHHQNADYHKTPSISHIKSQSLNVSCILAQLSSLNPLTHWVRVTHICVSKLVIISSDNGLSPGRRQAITWTNAGILLIGPLGTNFSEILIKIQLFSFRKMHLKVSFAKWWPFCLGLNV